MLDEHQRKLFKKHRASILPWYLAFSKILKDPRISEEGSEKLREKIGKNIEIIPLENGGVQIKLGDSDQKVAEELVEALKVMKSSTEHQALLYRSALISIISSAEWFLSQVIRQHLVLHVDAAGGKDKVLSLEDLKTLGSIQDATNYVIDSRIDELMWGVLRAGSVRCPIACPERSRRVSRFSRHGWQRIRSRQIHARESERLA